MTINKAIRTAMTRRGISLSAMGKALRKVDRKTGEVKELRPNDVSARLVNDNLSFNKAVEMLDVLGYEIVIQERTPGSRKVGQIVIDQKEDDTAPAYDLNKLLDGEPVLSKKDGKIKIKLT